MYEQLGCDSILDASHAKSGIHSGAHQRGGQATSTNQRDAPINPSFGYNEHFSWQPFLTTIKELAFKKEEERLRNGKKLSPTRKSRPKEVYKPRVRGGPNKFFIKKHDLDENSHSMEWLNSILPLTPKDNIEDAKKVNVTGD